jgi:hypothetical protein
MKMQTLDEPVYEVDQNSEWYQKERKRRDDIDNFFKEVKEKYGFEQGFSFYHSGYFGISGGTKDYEVFKDELLRNPDKNFYPFKKRSKYYKDIQKMIEQIEEISPFKSHDVFGLNNVSASQWIGDRWFFGVKQEKQVKGKEVSPIDFKEYLKIVMEHIEDDE